VLALTFATRRAAVFLALLGVVALAGANARASDVYDAAVGHAGRSSDDLKRDSLDHPADVLRLATIKPGMQVADFLAGDGYYSELLS
jgi:predicted methyltransferase